jgi:hypothetical protein
MFTVLLRNAEWEAAASLGLKREALRKSRGVVQTFDRSDRGGSVEKRNAVGAIAEYALARHYGLHRMWCETQAFSLEHWKIKSDVGHRLQVRASDNPRATLWLRDEPADRSHESDPFILARLQPHARSVTFVGWVYGREGLDPSNWDRLGWSKHGPGRAAFNVLDSALHDMALLPEELIYGPQEAANRTAAD